MPGGRQKAPSAPCFSLSAVLGGTLLSLAVTLLGSILIGLVVSLTDWDELPRSVQAIGYLSAAVGGLQAGRHAARIGWLHGGLVGVLYMAITTLVFKGAAAADALTAFLLALGSGFLAGAVGGIIGVNTR